LDTGRVCIKVVAMSILIMIASVNGGGN